MVKMIFHLMALEEGLKNMHYYLEHLDGEFPGLKNDPMMINLMDRLRIMEETLHETLTQWPQLGLDLTG
ncbi:MAG: hypothetical protein AB1491_06585 [Thermodesulfobacteriota bacterium]